ncbi:MAG: VCBS repeat-containing protein [Pirellulales bacterium]
MNVSPADQSSHSQPSSGGKGKYVIALAAVICLIGLVVVMTRRSPTPTPVPESNGDPGHSAGDSGKAPPGTPKPVRLTAAEHEKLRELKDRAIALLENENPQGAEPLWNELAVQLPREPLVGRNRALGRLLVATQEKTPEAFANAESSIRESQKLEPDSWIPYWMEGRLRLLDRDRQETPEKQDAQTAAAIAAFARAAAIDKKAAVPRFELYQAAKLSQDEKLVRQGQVALQEAYLLAPANLFIALDWLEVAADTRNETFPQVVDAFLQTIKPLAAGIKRRARVDVAQFIGQAVRQAELGAWPQATGIVRRLGFIRSEDVAQSDHRRIRPSPLELLVHSFVHVEAESLPVTPPPAIDVRFTRVQTPELKTGEAAATDMQILDFDVDGQQDIVLLAGEELIVYSQSRAVAAEGKDAASPQASPTLHDWRVLHRHNVGQGYTHFLAADFDRDDKHGNVPLPATPQAGAAAKDGQPGGETDATFFQADFDFIVYGPAGVLVLKNHLDEATRVRRLESVAQDSGLEKATAIVSGAIADFDHDGDVDLVTAGESGVGFWINRGNLTFDDVTSSSSPPPMELRIASLTAVDWDRDVDIDILVADASGQAIGYLENLRHIEFRWRSVEGDVEALRHAQSLAICESDGNVSWDVLAAGERGVRLLLTRTSSPGVVQPLRSLTLGEGNFRGAAPWDYDNDGYVDAIAWGDSGIRLFRGQGDGTLAVTVGAEIVVEPTAVAGACRACEAADLDGDGDLDVIALLGSEIALWKNEGGNRNPWLDVLVRGLDEPLSGRVSHFAIGSWVELKNGGRYQAQVVTGARNHFGLGAGVNEVEVVRVLFTNGVPQSVLAPQANHVVREAQALKGSCPYLYVWNGEQFEFFTDLLWNAPLGLQIADGVILRDRPWEYLKVEGEKLRATEGVYRLRITEELWEAGYFDRVELIAVDHPADVEVFTNEKVGPAEIAAKKIHTVKQRRSPVAARDTRGRDVLPLVLQRDDKYAQCYERTLRQGLAEPHFLELDLGTELGGASSTDTAASRRRVTLFLTGWIYPTDTSLNVGFSQNPELDGPRPPYLLVPDEKGGWREAVGFTGFPGGKTKTIAIDLTPHLAPGDGRLRIATSNEIRWDEAFFTVDEPTVELRETSLNLRSADLRYRGFSKPLVRRSAAEPDRYDYNVVDTHPKWPPMKGRFTRYGDVRELLADWDDRMVVMAAGDEMALEFDVGPPVPDGWKRDLLLHSVGWDKDADIHTVYGQTVEPMPFKAMPSYPYATHEYPDSSAIREYLRVFQTRESSLADFWRSLRGAK